MIIKKITQCLGMLLLLLLVSCTTTNRSYQNEEIYGSLVPDNFRRTPPTVGFNQNSIWTPKWSDKTFKKGIQRLNTEVLRYPGGNISQYFDWRTNKKISTQKYSPRQSKIKSRVKDRVYLHKSIASNNLVDLYQASQETGIEIIFCLNVLTSTLEEQIRFLRKAEQVGFDIKYIELGNEIYIKDRFYLSKYPDAKAYADEMNNWTSKIKTGFPSAKIAITCSFKEYEGSNTRRDDWNEVLLKNVKNFDAITLHIYPDNSLATPTANTVTQLIDELNDVLERGFPETKKEIWITEYNIMDKKSKSIWTTWIHGLYNSYMTLELLHQPNIDLLLQHSLKAGGNAVSALNATKGSTDNTLTAVGANLATVFDLIKNADTVQKLSLIQKESTPAESYISAWSFTKGNISKTILVNFSKESRNINISGIYNNTVQMTQQFLPTNKLFEKDILQKDIQVLSDQIQDTVRLVPFSITVLN